MTNDTRPAPEIPPDADLRDFPYMPLEVARLRDSELAGIAEAEAFRAAVLSWCVAWHQVPAGSLPSDDGALCRLLGYGRDVATWQRVKASGGLRGWTEHSDGRLYHPVVTDKALEALSKSRKNRERGKAGAAKRWRGDSQSIVQAMPEQCLSNASTIAQASNSIVGLSKSDSPTTDFDSKGREGNRIEGKAHSAEPVRIIEAFDEVRVAVYGEPLRRAWPAANDMVHAERLVAAGWTAETARGVFRASLEPRKAGGKAPPGGLAWFEQRFAELTPTQGARISRTTASGEYRDDAVDVELLRLIDERDKLPPAKRGPIPRRPDAERSLAERKRGAA